MKAKLLLLLLPLAFMGYLKSGNPSIAAMSVSKTITLKDSVFPAMTDTILLKDINNDRMPDTAFVYTPPTLGSVDEKGNVEYQIGCVDNNCYNKITFSCGLPEIRIEDTVWGAIENAGDLNGDGISELLFEPGWFTSSMGHLYLYSFKNGKWEINTSVTHRTNGEPLLPNLIKKGRHYYLRGIIFTEDDKPYNERIKFRK